MTSKRLSALLLAALVAWGSAGCVLLAKPAIDKARSGESAEEEDEEGKKKP